MTKNQLFLICIGSQYLCITKCGGLKKISATPGTAKDWVTPILEDIEILSIELEIQEIKIMRKKKQF